MKVFLKILGGLVVLAAIAGTAWEINPPLRAQTRLKVQVWGLNSGLIPVARADWGFLKLRAGEGGTDALRELERHSPRTDVRQAAAAVENQWFEKGHEFSCPIPICVVPAPLDHETRFCELRLPSDGMALARDLKPGQAISQSFWDDERFRIGCIVPPHSQSSCTIKMADMTGDSTPEIIVATRVAGMTDRFLKPAVAERWTIYARHGDDWSETARLHFDYVNQVESHDAHAFATTTPIDLLWLDGHAINFFDGATFGENVVMRSDAGLKGGPVMATRLKSAVNLTPGKTIPTTLIKALSERTIVLSQAGEPPEKDVDYALARQFRGLPPCLVRPDAGICGLVILDIDHDGSDDVVVLDDSVHQDVSTWRLASLLMERNGRWTVVSNHAACATAGETLAKMHVDVKPAAWRPVNFNGLLFLPAEATDTCNRHYMSL